MNDQQTWVEALNISPESLSQWSAQAPSGMPLLVYCLEQGLIPFEDYVAWAKEHFGLPELKSTFFQQALDPALVEQMRLQGEWTAWCFPVDQWDGVTLVACVEPPPQETQSSTRYVLADPRSMRQAWGSTSTANVALPPQLPPDMPIGMTAEVQPFKLNLDAAFNLNAEAEEKEAPPDQDRTVVHMIQEPTAEAKKPKAPPAPAAVSKDENGAIQAMFTTLRERYTGSLVMKCTGEHATIYKWDENLKPPGDPTKVTVNLTYPTFVRIVAKTNLPYHGYLVDSPAHREFFAALGITVLPVCVTAIPVRFDTRLWGIVVAFGPEENQKMDSLNFAQENTEKLVSIVGNTWSKAA